MSGLGTLRVFVADGCPVCRELVADFRRRGVRFELVDLSLAPERVAELKAMSWERRLPVVVDHERVSVGFAGRSTPFAALGFDDW